MKKKIVALMCALSLLLGLAGCMLSTPDTVGKLGNVEITSGLYLLAQYDAYQQAADLAGDDQDPTKVKAFLKQSITVDADAGETMTVSDYVAQKTLETLEIYAAIESRFDELGGQLTEQQQATADAYAQQIMEQYGDTYKANGIGLETIQRFETIMMKSQSIIMLTYGPEGETPVSDEEVSDYLSQHMVRLAYAIVPMYNPSTFAFASDSQREQMIALANSAMDSYTAAAAGVTDGSEQVRLLSAIAQVALPDIYAVQGASYTAESDGGVSTNLLDDSVIDTTFTENDTAAAVRALHYGEGAVLEYNGYSIMLAVRIDPLTATTLDALREQVLNNMKSDELANAIKDYGAQLENTLSSSTMRKLPASKIVKR